MSLLGLDSLYAQVEGSNLIGSAADNSGRLILTGGVIAILAIGAGS